MVWRDKGKSSVWSAKLWAHCYFESELGCICLSVSSNAYGKSRTNSVLSCQILWPPQTQMSRNAAETPIPMCCLKWFVLRFWLNWQVRLEWIPVHHEHGPWMIWHPNHCRVWKAWRRLESRAAFVIDLSLENDNVKFHTNTGKNHIVLIIYMIYIYVLHHIYEDIWSVYDGTQCPSISSWF